MGRQTTKIISFATVGVVALMLVRLFVMTTYYVSPGIRGQANLLPAKSLAFVSLWQKSAGEGELLVYRQGAEGRPALGEVLALPGDEYPEDKSTLPVPSKGQVVLMDSTRVQRLTGLVAEELAHLGSQEAEKRFVEMKDKGFLRFSQDYLLIRSEHEQIVWVPKRMIIGTVAGHLPLP